MTTESKNEDATKLEEKLNKALESIAKLEEKNKELLQEKQKANTQADEDRERLEAAEEEKARKENDLKALEERITQRTQREIEKREAKIADYETRLNTLLIDNAINGAMVEHNVLPQFREAVTALFKSKATLANGEAVANNLPLSDYISDFMSGEAGKAYVAADYNTGAAVTNQTTVTNAGWSKAPVTAQEMEAYLQLASENPAQANQYASAWGRPDLKV